MASFANTYTHRKVADTASKACEICYKPSSSVLVSPGNKDFFYVCPAHLKDKGFCSPIVDEAALVAKKKQAMDAEVERVKQEFEEKQKKKNKEKAPEIEGKKDKDKKDTEKTAEKKPDEKESQESIPISVEEEPRVFALQKTFYQLRIDKKRSAEMARRNRERLQNPNLFPQVPKGFP